MNIYLQSTALLDYETEEIQNLIRAKKWKELDAYHKILEIYNYVRDEVLFGYNADDAIKASQVLKEGYGQCNTKGTLFMALLRSVGIPCRIHGFYIDKKLQKGAMTGFVYNRAPKEIVHSWIEVFFDHNWLNMEGFILDTHYLSKLQEKFSGCTGNFCGYGVATDNFKSPQINWNNNDTYIQNLGITKDFGIYHSPDEFFKQHSQNLSRVKKLLFQMFGRHLMNQNISRIRGEK